MAGAAAVSALGGIVLVGWYLDVDVLKSVVPGPVTMKANTAAGFLLAGLSLWLLTPPHPSRGALVLSKLAASVVLLLGVTTLVEYLAHTSLGIDQILITEPPGEIRSASPGRPSAATAIAFATSGGALLVGRTSREGRFPEFAFGLVGDLSPRVAMGRSNRGDWV